MSSPTVRTRIAPSPTGDPHVGTAYIALFNLCYARQHGGQFILRIEDTDQQRSSVASEQKIFDSLRWLGLNWDEGPDVGGDHGPYRQSERTLLYREFCQQLIDEGKAFYCFATAQELDDMRREQIARGETPKYDGRGLALSTDEAKQRVLTGESHVIRMKVPEQGVCKFDDLLRGTVEIPWAQVDMQILLKNDGMPTYHLANVVDDHLMAISHVIRGEEWINSAPKHQLLYQYFGWEMPVLCHMPLLRNPDKSKLSKRKNPTGINYFRAMGYLPEAVINYLGRMGWSMPDGEEKFYLDQMIEHFNIEHVHLGGPVFDIEKLDWLNGRWIREDLDDNAFAARVAEWALNGEKLRQFIPLVKDRVEKFSDLAAMTDYLLFGYPDITASSFEQCKLDTDISRQILQFSAWLIDDVSEWDRDDLYQRFSLLAKAMDVKLKELLAPLFITITGRASAPPLFDSMVILGPDMVRARIRRGLETLGRPSKKQLKAMEKAYRALT
jgi:glutamyl-tRNA synthetase